MHSFSSQSFVPFSLVCVYVTGDVRPFIRNIFKTHELVNKARNGERDIGSPLHYPVTVSPEEAEKARGAGAATAAGGAVSSAPPEEEGAAKE